MPTLADQLLSATARPRLVRDCARFLDEEVARKSGLSGLAIKGAFKTIKAIKPGFIEGVIHALLDEWVAKLEAHHDRWLAQGSSPSFAAFASADASAVAERLLEVTDARAERTTHSTALKLYRRLRPNAKGHVVTGVPGLTRVVESYLA